jgi:shikimate dehydrogenase
VRRPPGRLVLLGHPVRHSLSPRMQSAALRAAGIELRYEAIDVAPAHVQQTLAALREEGAAGNITIPYKEEVALACESLSPLAKRTGAVNTFWIDDGILCGDNTDAAGFEQAALVLVGRIPTRAKLAVLGAGGGAAGVLAAMERWDGCSVRLYNRTTARAHALATRFPSRVSVAASAREAVSEAVLVVNASAVGLRDDALPVPIDALSPNAAVLDLVYRAGETPFVRAARAAGHRAADGTRMLVEQGALAFERWFGIAPDRAVMWEAVQLSG